METAATVDAGSKPKLLIVKAAEMLLRIPVSRSVLEEEAGADGQPEDGALHPRETTTDGDSLQSKIDLRTEPRKPDSKALIQIWMET